VDESSIHRAAFPHIYCTRCSLPYPAEGIPFDCPQCGGVFDTTAPPAFDPPWFRKNNRDCGVTARLWFALKRANGQFGGRRHAPDSADRRHKTAWLKLESLNPTGSYKDRGSAVLLSALAARGVTYAVEDSSGNAGASFAAYAARAGISARVFVPESASGPKRAQIEAYGADLVGIPGPRSAAAEAVLKEARAGAAYASHAYLPFGLAGIATIAYELWEQMGSVPGTVVAPVGHGGLLLGIMRGFAGLRAAGLIVRRLYYAGVQARACAPVWEAFTGKQRPKAKPPKV
jgi:threonine synthase